jgi:hypothetical protein
VYGVNSGCLSLENPEGWQEWINEQNLPEGIEFIYTGTQCFGIHPSDYTEPYSCHNTAWCSINFGCDTPEFAPCSRLDEGACIDVGRVVQCTDDWGNVVERNCCGEANPLPGIGNWRAGDDCDDLANLDCQEGCCSCGSENGVACEYCTDSGGGLGGGQQGSRANIHVQTYIEHPVCGSCEVVCEEGLSADRTLPQTNTCGYWANLAGGSESSFDWVRKTCEEGGAFGWNVVGFGSTNSNYVFQGEPVNEDGTPADPSTCIYPPDCPPPEPVTEPIRTCTEYVQYAKCGTEEGGDKVVVKIDVETKNCMDGCDPGAEE